jgi:uncharacterized pyridoxamine 5'-phosphate oxidase family protein
MKKIFDFIQQHKEIALATTNKNGNPAIRVFQIMLIDEAGKALFFATSPKKEIFKQLKNNPNIEILCFADNISVRISGKAFFDIPDTVCKKIYSTNSALPKLYKQYTDLVYFRLFIKKAEYFKLNSATPIHECFECSEIM